MEYKFSDIEKEIKNLWKQKDVYRIANNTDKPKYYVLDMFPYPSGAGLHVGHPLGYIASDIYSRYKRMKGFNVLHPMGYDSFGLPAEQYAIQTGQHPAVTTEKNIETFRRQMDQLGFSFDWSRQVKTSDPDYYRWTQWIFIQLFYSWYNKNTDKAERIETLIAEFEKNGNKAINAATEQTDIFSSEEWKSFSEKQKNDVLLNYRLAYIGESVVNWCAALGTVLANDEVKDGVSERGGYPVERKKMKQWMLRITAYSERLLEGLNRIEWSESIKESQRNWIGKSEGATVKFQIADSGFQIEVFTTRPDTIFGVTFVTLAPEHELIEKIVTPEYKKQVAEYVAYAKNRSERERMTDVKKVTGQFTGAYAIHPFTGKQIPVWIGEYVLAGYGSGAVMGVPSHDSRDYGFAKHFNLPIVEVIQGGDISKEAFEGEGININSDFLNGLKTPEAKQKAIEEIENKKIGERKTNFKQRDAVFGRQRYWGEPIPVYYDKEGIPHTVEEKDLPLILPEIDKYLPTETGEPPLARAKEWKYKNGNLETTTMPGWAGSSWYFLRYMDPHNENTFVSKEVVDYWQNIDLYVGGAEHATGHLLYFRFWTKFLFDLGLLPFDEPAKRLVNQGMLQGRSALFFRSAKNQNLFYGLDENGKEEYLNIESASPLYADIALLVDEKLPLNNLRSWRAEYANAEFYTKDKNGLTPQRITEKMSKSKYNVVNPDDVVAKYGADCFRLYEMFLGPIELSKPWDTKGIDGVSRFLRKLWKLFYDDNGNPLVTNEPATKEELKALHKAIKKTEEDMEKLSFNTSVSSFMICVNTLTDLKCHKTEVLKDLLLIIAPFAPFTTEYLWQQMKQEESIVTASFPKVREELLVENSFEYPVAVNGKTRTKIMLPLDALQEQIEKEVLALQSVQQYLEGKTPKKVIVVKGRMVNVVV